MAYEISWKLEGRVILLRLWDVLSLAEAQEVSEKLNAILQEGSTSIHFIVNMDGLHISPSGIQTNLRLTSYLRHPNFGWMVTIGGTPLTQFISKLVQQFVRFKLHHADSLEAAIEFLCSQDASLEVLN